MPKHLRDILPLASKPSRYIGAEVNACVKDPAGVSARVALCFPDAYEVGMSHLGLRILYEAVNRRPDLYAERAYAPWPDMEELIRREGLKLSTLETQRPLSEFDIVGFTLQYELSYTNVLNMLELGGVPVFSRERGGSDPLVVAGGPCAVNPEPLHEFIDAFVIGDAEDAVVELAEAVVRHKQAGRPGGRAGLLKAVSAIEGVYVPAHFEVRYGEGGRISSIKNVAGGPDRVRRRILPGLEGAPYPEAPIVPYTAAVHDRVSLEVARGCMRGCRFCQAGYIYRPVRERSPRRIAELAERSLAATGYDELSLASLSTGDYPALLPLMKHLMDRHAPNRVSVSLPSLRVGTLTPQMCAQVRRVRKTGFTVAPEAGTERLRAVINKNITEDALVATARTVFSEGWDLIKLYFMVGLPTETDEDVEGIVRLARLVLDAGRGAGGPGGGRRKKVNVGVSAFVPKPHTPFQWMGQAPMDELRRKKETLARVLGRKPFALKTGLVETSALEAAFARGGRDLSGALYAAWRMGARFDGWSERFDFALWGRAFAEAGLDIEAEACRSYGLDETLPWDHIDIGVTKRFLKRELARASKAESTPDCRAGCAGCGLKCTEEQLSPPEPQPLPEVRPGGRGDTGPSARVRLTYTKLGPVSLISHSELMAVFFRAAARAGLPIRFSEGFNPHPKVSFGPALAVGIESEAELLDMELDRGIDLAQVVGRLNRVLPSGMRVAEARVVGPHEPPAGVGLKSFTYELAVPEGFEDDAAGLAARFAASRAVAVTRQSDKGEKEVDIRPMVGSIEAVGGGDKAVITFTLVESDGRMAKPFEVAQALFGLTPMESRAVRLKRTAMR